MSGECRRCGTEVEETTEVYGEEEYICSSCAWEVLT